IKIFGDDQEALKKYAKQVAKLVDETKGTADVFDGITIAGPEIIVEPNTVKLAQYNISPADFKFEMQNKIEGNVVGTVIEKNRLTDIRTIETDKYPLSLNDFKKSQIILPSGRMKPLEEFADIRLTKGVAEIDRENLKMMIPVIARLDNRDLGSTLKEIQGKIAKTISLPYGYNIEFGGAYAEQQNAFRELLTILLAASFLVFVVILFLFKSLKVSLLIIFLSVIGISGSLLALFITNTPLNVGSYTGMIMIVGIIGENSIFTYLQYQKERLKTSRDDSIIYAISTRLRPKLMTALGAITALFPLALGIGTGAQMHQPLAIAIIGGLVIALPLLLVALPTGIRIIEK
ncbi:MAG: efflux RND transporter permease subunit, partial [FCB group bacterium]